MHHTHSLSLVHTHTHTHTHNTFTRRAPFSVWRALIDSCDAGKLQGQHFNFAGSACLKLLHSHRSVKNVRRFFACFFLFSSSSILIPMRIFRHSRNVYLLMHYFPVPLLLFPFRWVEFLWLSCRIERSISRKSSIRKHTTMWDRIQAASNDSRKKRVQDKRKTK